MPEWILPALLILGTISLALVTVFHAVTLLTLRRTRRAAEGPLPALSVLKPVCGHDDGLYENLTAIARQDYPDFEVLVGAADPSDPALEVACRVQRENPGVRMRVVVSDRSLGLNRKVANVAGLAARARHEWLLVSDSNVRPDPDHLRSMAGELRDARVGLVSSVLAGTGERTTGALLENAHLDSFIVSTVCMGDRLGHPCVIGKSMLLRRADLARVGGWEAFADLLAEDYLMGQRFRRAGIGVALCARPLPTINASWSVGDFLSRHLRWSLMRRRINLGAYLAEPLLYTIPWMTTVLVVAALAPAGAWTRFAAGAAVVGIAAKTALDAALARRVRGRGFGLPNAAWLPVKDLLLAGVWAVGLFRRTITWRGTTLRVGRGSRLSPVARPALPVPAVES